MGLGASQARFLSLTARQNNVEFQGQQVNQQRINLANQSAIQNKASIALNVPVPPSIEDFTKTEYSFKNGTQTITIDQMYSIPGATPTSEFNYNVDLIYSEEKQGTAFVGNSSLKVARQADAPIPGVPQTYSYFINGESLRQLDTSNPTEQAALSTLRERTAEINADAVAKGEAPPYNANEVFYKYGDRYVAASDLKNWASDNTTRVKPFEIGAQDVTQSAHKQAYISFTESGRPMNIKIDGVNHQLDVKTVKDEDKFQDAMNQYEYDKAQYEKKMADINAKLEDLQHQDKTLELQLKQFDTEQEAIQTELAAVKKVIDKNISNTFKSFA